VHVDIKKVGFEDVGGRRIHGRDSETRKDRSSRQERHPHRIRLPAFDRRRILSPCL
jgi:hypothetical protein